ncbi:hypothetical protein YcfC [Buchnera aphidicola str. Bp (Baizongia pistaciae)]|nr:hypothetical protein YcfC [Buchnera aphidicola str. Bp (Baizongia pistaciae)]
MLSLAGICQSIVLVNQLSETGECHSKSFEICIDSMLNLYPTTVLSIYGNKEKNLKLGITTLMSLLNVNAILKCKNSIKMIRYIFNLITLENRLENNIKYKNILFKELSILIQQHKNRVYTYDLLADRLAQIYLDTVSKLGFRIQVSGSKKVLHNIVIQNKIRCILLSGIRATMLWKQIGGRRYQFVFYRNSIFHYADMILKKINDTKYS